MGSEQEKHRDEIISKTRSKPANPAQVGESVRGLRVVPLSLRVWVSVRKTPDFPQVIRGAADSAGFAGLI